MPFSLPSLPYSTDALEPHIDQRTMGIHHGKHHATYVTNLNDALGSTPELEGKSLEELLANGCAAVPEGIRTAVRNNGGGTLQSLPVLDDHGTWRLQQSRWESCSSDQRGFWECRRFQGEVCCGRRGQIRLRLGLVGKGCFGFCFHHFNTQSRQSRHGGWESGSRSRCVGACLLSQLPESQA